MKLIPCTRISKTKPSKQHYKENIIITNELLPVQGLDEKAFSTHEKCWDVQAPLHYLCRLKYSLNHGSINNRTIDRELGEDTTSFIGHCWPHYSIFSIAFKYVLHFWRKEALISMTAKTFTARAISHSNQFNSIGLSTGLVVISDID